MGGGSDCEGADCEGQRESGTFSGLQCFESRSQVMVDEQHCPAKCCVYRDDYGKLTTYADEPKQEARPNSLAFCGTQRECRMRVMYDGSKRKRHGDSSMIG